MDIINKIGEMQARSEARRLAGEKIAFVPTMGFLHQGHMSLLKEGRNRGDDLILSIFVNPTQFAQGEDLDAYPKSIERDLGLAEKEGVDAVFLPDAAQMYGENYQTYVSLEKLPNYLCGISRPTHFRGVATVVTKLFNIVKPHVAIFGEKDFQQLAVIRQMVCDLNMDIDIIGGAIVREKDGLAMSSRNAYLSQVQRQSALCLFYSLQHARKLVKNGVNETEVIIQSTREIIESQPETCIDYLMMCDPVSLESKPMIQGPTLFALAVKVGNTRLIDNMILEP
ncbi:MAG: pantoate--beta-alanine ligase [Proteobacteria bacterium]|nr:pantoate--beta-alanine ligase [Pseudomonadota bacterium]